MRQVIYILIFANYIYGIAAVALAIENNLQLGIPLNSCWFYVLLFCATTAFYGYSYHFAKTAPTGGNLRAQWLYQHRVALMSTQAALVVISLIAGWKLWQKLPETPPSQLMIYIGWMAIFPFIGMLYYGISFPGIFHFKLRQIGWLKPFTISLVWAGCVSVMPVVLKAWENGTTVFFPPVFAGYFIHNWMFIGVLCILFDIKDYAADHNHQLKTFVVRIGLRRTLFYIIAPLTGLGFLSLIAFWSWQQHSSLSLVLNLIPVLLIVAIALSLRQRRSIAYYLLVIDGLLIIKALCGITGVWLR